jgi:hypothetical protein
MINEEFFERIDTEAKSYWLGFWMADGFYRKNEYVVGIGLNIRDKDHLQKFASIFDVPLKIYEQRDKRNDKIYRTATVLLCSKHMWLSMAALGIPQKKTLTDSAEVLKHVSDDLLHHFVRGYMDGDGSVYNRSNDPRHWSLVFVNGNATFLQGLEARIRHVLELKPIRVRQTGTNTFRLEWIGLRTLDEIRTWFYQDATIYLERKKEKFDRMPIVVTHSKHKGVTYHKHNGLWMAQVAIGRQTVYVGSYKTESEAAEAAEKARAEGASFKREKAATSSSYRGVTFHKREGKWRAQINIDGKRKMIGSYRTQEEAARAYNEAALKYHGDKAKLNEV